MWSGSNPGPLIVKSGALPIWVQSPCASCASPKTRFFFRTGSIASFYRTILWVNLQWYLNWQGPPHSTHHRRLCLYTKIRLGWYSIFLHSVRSTWKMIGFVYLGGQLVLALGLVLASIKVISSLYCWILNLWCCCTTGDILLLFLCWYLPIYHINSDRSLILIAKLRGWILARNWVFPILDIFTKSDEFYKAKIM